MRPGSEGLSICLVTTYKFVNKKFCEIHGYTYDELVDKVGYLDTVHPEDQKRIEEATKHHLMGEVGYSAGVFRIVRKDGEIRNLRVVGGPIIYHGRPGVSGTAMDVTREKALEIQLNQAQKMEAVGIPAGGIAHDFNNLLMVILGYTSLMLMKTDAKDPNYEKLKIIEEQVQMGANLTKQLLGFARGGKYEIRTTNINEVLAMAANMFGRTKKEISVFKKLEKDLWNVDADIAQMEQVFLNLFVNAWQAMPTGGDLYIETRNTILDERYCAIYSINPGKYVVISISDTGIGMDTATQHRIFEPFFTTKEVGQVAGLGLASAYGIVKNHGGTINVYSEKGKGSTFNIYLPSSREESAEDLVLAAEIFKGTETILIVDDQAAVTNAGRDILKSLGYKVLTANSGKEAVEIYEKDPRWVDLVILDMIMPGMSGGDTFALLKNINPSVKVILASGYSINGQATKIMELGCKGFIQKPFTIGDLSKKIREVLDGNKN